MYQADTRRKILNYERQYRTWAERMAELRLQEDLHILKDAQVVGMTTTGRKVGGIYLLKSSFPWCLIPSDEANMVTAIVAGSPYLGTFSYLLHSLKLQHNLLTQCPPAHLLPTISALPQWLLQPPVSRGA